MNIFEYIKIGGYEIKKTKDLILYDDKKIRFNNLKSLFQCYHMPSSRKFWAYNDCVNLVNTINKIHNCCVYQCGISGYNSMMFTYIIYCELDGVEYIIRRTNKKDEITKVIRILK